jgi:hypothetical protein
MLILADILPHIAKPSSPTWCPNRAADSTVPFEMMDEMRFILQLLSSSMLRRRDGNLLSGKKNKSAEWSDEIALGSGMAAAVARIDAVDIGSR